MAEKIKIPGVGAVKKQYAIAGAVIVLLIVGVAYWRQRNAPPETPAEQLPADGSYTDPTSGSTYPSGYLGEPGYYPSGGTPYSPYGYDIYGNPLPAPTGAGTSGGVYSTNNDWSEAAETALEKGGVSRTVSAEAISKVLAGLTVTPAQRDIFLRGIGLLGQPPQSYPQPIRLSASPSSGSTTKPPAGKSLPAPTGLKITGVTRTSARVDWNPVAGAKAYVPYIVIDPPGGSTPVGIRQGTLAATEFTPQRLKPGTRYRVDVHAMGTDNVNGARARAYFTTKK